jgi:hypothetical protein
LPEFPTQPAVEIARRLEIRGSDSSSWVALLAPLENADDALSALRSNLSALLRVDARTLDLRDSHFEDLRQAMHYPPDDVVILTATGRLGRDQWTALDLMRSALERAGPIIIWVSLEGFAELAQYAPNIRSFIGPSAFAVGPDGGVLSDEERAKRLRELAEYYEFSNDDLIRKAEAREIPSDPRIVEWLILLGRSDLV